MAPLLPQAPVVVVVPGHSGSWPILRLLGKNKPFVRLVGAFSGPSLLIYVKKLPDRGVDDWQATRPSVAKPPLAVFLRRQK